MMIGSIMVIRTKEYTYPTVILTEDSEQDGISPDGSRKIVHFNRRALLNREPTITNLFFEKSEDLNILLAVSGEPFSSINSKLDSSCGLTFEVLAGLTEKQTNTTSKKHNFDATE